MSHLSFDQSTRPFKLAIRLLRTRFFVGLMNAGIVLCCEAPAHARPFTPSSAYSFDAPVDLYLSEDDAGCAHHAAQQRKSHARLLGMVLYPSAYCSLMQSAICTYLYAADAAQALTNGEHGSRRSSFIAQWDDACVRTNDRLAQVATGKLVISDASDLGMQGTYDLTLESGEQLRGFFDSTPCPRPMSAAFVCR